VTDRFDVPVRLFGRHRDLVGEPVVRVELDAGGTVGDLRRRLGEHPRLAGALEGSVVALNRKYETDESTVLAGDEVAIIPPVAGG
jgi:molybdopterin converting factor small subunit